MSEKIFESFLYYDWEGDQDFMDGIKSLDQSKLEEIKSFYFKRKEPLFDYNKYLEWKERPALSMAQVRDKINKGEELPKKDIPDIVHGHGSVSKMIAPAKPYFQSQ